MRASPLQVLFAARLRDQLGTRDAFYREHYGLHFMIDGRAQVRIGSRRFELDGDWVWTGWPGPRIAFAPAGRLPRLHYRAAVSGSLLETWLAEGLLPRLPLPVADAPRLQALTDRLLAVLVGDEPLHTRLRANALEAFLLELHRQQREGEDPPSWVLEAQRLLTRNWRRPPDYPALARHFQMPLPTLRRGFRRAVGLPIHTWLLRERHREAQRLLLETDHDLATIAEACGYADPAYFSRQFKRLAGLPPSAFRRSAYS